MYLSTYLSRFMYKVSRKLLHQVKPAHSQDFITYSSCVERLSEVLIFMLNSTAIYGRSVMVYPREFQLSVRLSRQTWDLARKWEMLLVGGLREDITYPVFIALW